MIIISPNVAEMNSISLREVIGKRQNKTNQTPRSKDGVVRMRERVYDFIPVGPTSIGQSHSGGMR